jgi:hypothetical protein
LAESLTKQFRGENESLKKEFSSELKSEILNLTDAVNQLRKDTDLEVANKDCHSLSQGAPGYLNSNRMFFDVITSLVSI